MKRFISYTFLFIVMLLLMGTTRSAAAQEGSTAPAVDPPPLSLFTAYPAQIIGPDDAISIPFTLRVGSQSQVVALSVKEMPENWAASFKGGSHLVTSAYVEPEKDVTIDLKLTAPGDVQAGDYTFIVMAEGDRTHAEFPLTLTVEDRLPPRLAMSVDLPTLRGRPSTTFHFNAKLHNEGDEDLSVDLTGETPSGFTITFKSSGQEVTNLPIEANATKTVNIDVTPLGQVPANDYTIAVHAQADELHADATLTAEVIGESSVTLTTPDGRLSGPLHAGDDSPVTLLLQNTGSAPATNIQLTSTQPTGWKVDFSPKTVDQIGPNSQVEVVATVHPTDNAIAGDYVLTFRAQPKDSATKSVEYRATVRTSTLWGIGGIALIALAVGVVGLAVSRYGRR
jgi:uncharacterized membrane protein